MTCLPLSSRAHDRLTKNSCGDRSVSYTLRETKKIFPGSLNRLLREIRTGFPGGVRTSSAARRKLLKGRAAWWGGKSARVVVPAFWRAVGSYFRLASLGLSPGALDLASAISV